MMNGFEKLDKLLAISPEKLTDMMNSEVKFIKETGLGEFTPHLSILAINGETEEEEGIMVGLIGNFDDQETKGGMMRKVAEMLLDKQFIPISVILATEAWVSKRTDPTDTRPPSEDPNREEVIQVSALTFLGLTGMTFAKIDHKVDFLGDFENIRIDHWNDEKSSKPFLIQKIYSYYIEKMKNIYGFAVMNLPNFN
jgi:hypothetical protein